VIEAARPILECREIAKHYGALSAVDGVSLTVQSGETIGIGGPNGAGKTTLFNVICGLQPPATGRVLIGGHDVTKLPPYRRARAGLARTFQRLELFSLLTVRGNVRVAASEARRTDRSLDIERLVDRLLERVGLRGLADVRVDELPTGQARLVELARALAVKPKVLLLDEPASGQDETETAAFASLLHELADEGMAVVLVEHDVRLVMRTCEWVHVLDFGEILVAGSPDAIQHDERVIAAYLGAPT
jgi:branched-chain amino acid transport system ATP-binding protein